MDDLLPHLLPLLRRLLPSGSRVVVAVSGGADSQALLDLLGRAAAPLRLAALHACGVDHGLRAAAAGELRLAEQLARRHGVPFARLPVSLAPRGNRLAEARRARYAALRGYAREHGLRAICLAHHADDQAETLLQRLCRGTTVAGLAAMRPRRGMLVRPLLQLRRAALRDYARLRRLAWADDPSNDDLRTARGRMRRRIFPELTQLGSQAVRQMGALAERAAQDDAYLRRQAGRLLQRACRAGPAPRLAVALEPLQRAPAALRQRALQAFVSRWLGHPAPTAFLEALWRVVQLTPREHGRWPAFGAQRFGVADGALWAVPRRWSLRAAGQRHAWLAAQQRPLQFPERYQLDPLDLTLRATRRPLAAAGAQHFASLGRESVAFDADRLHFGLNMRPWRAGDRLQPFGHGGHISVGDLFTNLKVPRALRHGWPVITHGDHIIWVVGMRRAACAPVLEQTRQVVCLQASFGYAAIEES